MPVARTRPLPVEVVGLFPLYFKLCPRGMPWGMACGLEWPEEQARDYGPDERARERQLQELVARLAADFGPRIRLVSVPLASWRGAWLAWRHGLATGEVAVVAGGRAARLTQGYDRVRAVVAEALRG